MDIYSNTVEIIKLVKTLYDKYSEYRDADRTISEARSRLWFALTKLELFQEYLQVTQQIPENYQGTVYTTLSTLSGYARQLSDVLPQEATMPTKIAWVGWRKRKAEALVEQLRRWNGDATDLFMMLDMVKKYKDQDNLLKNLHDDAESGLTGALNLSRRIYSLESFEATANFPSLQLETPISFPQPNPTTDRMLSTYQGHTVFLEVHHFEEGDAGQRQRQLDTFQRLSYVFQSPDLPSIHLLSCRGLYTDSIHDRCLTIYDLPGSLSELPPHSHVPTLAHLLQSQVRFTMEDRYRIAVEACVAVFSIHAAGWVHKNIRSDNILIAMRPESDPKAAAVLDTSYLVGFQTTRPRMEMSDQRPEMDPIKRRYQHPERQGGRDSRVVKFDIRHDMYSLGAVLVEIGYRKTIRDLFSVSPTPSDPRPKEAETNHENLVKCARRLGEKMGTKYGHAVLTCLERTTEKGITSNKLRDEFYEQVLRPLKEILNGMQVVSS